MVERYRLLARAFINGSLKERGAVVTLPRGQRPGVHMERVKEMPALPVEAAFPTVSDEAIAAHALMAPTSSGPSNEGENLNIPSEEPPPHPGFVVVDCETNGFNDPRIASIAVLLADGEFNIQHVFRALVRPSGWEMSEHALAVHGLTMERLEAEGAPIAVVLDVLAILLHMDRTLVAHNLEFDARVILNEFKHAGRPAPAVDGVCTMKKARAQGFRGTLAVAYEALVGKPLLEAHDAEGDARACLDVLRELWLRGVIA